MGNIQPAGGRKPLQEVPGFAEHYAQRRQILADKCRAAVEAEETGITISYNDLLVHNPNRDLYDDYLIDQKEIRKILNEVVHQPYTVENQVVKTGDVVFYAMSFLKILFVYGMPAAAAPVLQPTSPAIEKVVPSKPAQIQQNELIELSDQDINTLPDVI